MSDFNKEEFWERLRRLNESCAALKREAMALAELAKSREDRLIRPEILAILEDLRRNREGGARP